ncbi:MAG: ribosomal RNA small subunit methyltransferase A [Proteobacteria bacterium]|nr:ribosomal RNA small subunit methyltransferase A [Pseudomonadota bacterium]MBU1386271.1 ribosomal RNA small subunit methyltransferase A [Pseudomonadota bacterium]MBU2479986.1 ribosomal RNA small subunit methyltransferase A [Pseudomonadota bacterium]
MTHPGQLLKTNSLYAGKELGQNFLSDPNTADMIVRRTGISKHSHVLEIGPGLGALTLPIARITDHVTVVEKDFRLVPLLKQELENAGLNHVTILTMDALKLDIRTIVKDQKLVVIGNLPYNISSQILFKLVEDSQYIEKAFLMFQKELATRILAAPGGKDYSRLTAVVKYAADINFVADVGPHSFFPKPAVDSTILRFDFFEEKAFGPEQEKLLFNVIKAAFSKRRKSLKNSMEGGEFKFEKPFIINALESAGIDPQRRAETLSVEEFKSLARAIWEST